MKYTFILLFSLLIFSCDNNTKTVEESNPEKAADAITNDAVAGEPASDSPSTESPSSNFMEFNMEELYGSYVGMFIAEEYGKNKKDYTYANKINISIDEIAGDAVKGHSVVAGNDRPFSGTITTNSEGDFEVKVSEPGDDKYDGVFNFNISPVTKKMKGFWTANDEKLKVTKRKYDLDKRDFEYTPSFNLEGWSYTDIYNTYNEDTGESEILTIDVAKFNPSTTELKKSDVENMKKGDLEVMRNSIYARHGYSFKNRKMRYIFNYVDWYIPMHTDIRASLTDLEKKNIDLMKRYEQHAERYYDSFGR